MSCTYDRKDQTKGSWSSCVWDFSGARCYKVISSLRSNMVAKYGQMHPPVTCYQLEHNTSHLKKARTSHCCAQDKWWSKLLQERVKDGRLAAAQIIDTLPLDGLECKSGIFLRQSVSRRYVQWISLIWTVDPLIYKHPLPPNHFGPQCEHLICSDTSLWELRRQTM